MYPLNALNARSKTLHAVMDWMLNTQPPLSSSLQWVSQFSLTYVVHKNTKNESTTYILYVTVHTHTHAHLQRTYHKVIRGVVITT